MVLLFKALSAEEGVETPSREASKRAEEGWLLWGGGVGRARPLVGRPWQRSPQAPLGKPVNALVSASSLPADPAAREGERPWRAAEGGPGCQEGAGQGSREAGPAPYQAA